MLATLGHSLRRSARSPGFSLTVLALVALAVFANATAFGTLYTLRWKSLPFPDGDRLVVPQADLPAFGVRSGLSLTLRDRLREQPQIFEAVAGYTDARPRREQDTRSDWRVSRVSAELLPMLGAQPGWGRAPAADEADAVLISHAAWQRHFGGDPGFDARRLRIDGRVLRVVGVMPEAFAFPDRRTDAWTPYIPDAEEQVRANNGNVGDLEVLARLPPGVTPGQARETLAAIFAAEPGLTGLRDQAGLSAVVTRLRDTYGAESQTALSALSAAALLLLVVAGFNLGSLLLERVTRRERELAVRRALGASRRELLLAAAGDLSVLTAAGAALGLLALPFGVSLLQQTGVLAPELPVRVALDPAIAGAGLALGALLVAGALAVGGFGSVRRIAAASLNAPASRAGLGRLRGALLIGQLALTTVLLGGALLLLRSTANLLAEDTGFDRRNVLLANIDLDSAPGADAAAASTQAQQLRDVLAALPGVSAIGQVNLVPFSGSESVSASSWPDGEPPRRARSRLVSPGYFDAMGVQLQTGREFASADLSDPAGVVVIDQLYADRYLQGRDPLTSTVRMPTDQQGGSRRARVVGVARTVRHTSLDEQTDLPTLYELGDNPAQMSWYAIRADADPAALASSVRGAVERRFPTARVSTLLPLGELVERSVRQRRAIGRAVAIFGGTTLVLAVLGLYAALAFAFQRRRQELAVRLALGARPTGIVALVLRQGVLLAVLSLPLGVIVGVLLAGRQATLLYQLGPADPTTWISAAIGVLFATAAAAMPAAWAAARVAPQAALRAE